METQELLKQQEKRARLMSWVIFGIGVSYILTASILAF